jgi:hypothetical protein
MRQRMLIGARSLGPRDARDAGDRLSATISAVLKGKQAAEMPIMQAIKFEFVINLQTAAASALRCQRPCRPLLLGRPGAESKRVRSCFRCHGKDRIDSFVVTQN